MTNIPNGGIVNLATHATGGVVEMYIMTGSGPDEIIHKYHSIVGNPVLTP